MARSQLELLPKPPRAKPRKLMHVRDAGNGPAGSPIVQFQCRRCGYQSDWLPMRLSHTSNPKPGALTLTESKRGIPCPKCNEDQA